MKALDSLGRRTRTKPSSTGKRITPQPADLIWFQKLAAHGPLPSSYLLAFTRHLRRSDKRATERLTDLFNEENTKHGGRYLDRPAQQFRTIDSRYNQLVYDLAPAGRHALQNFEEAVPSLNSGGPWLHRFMVACTTASIEIGTLSRPEVTFIPAHQILARAEAALRYPINAETNSLCVTADLIPDALFGLAYRTEEGERFRFFAVECDRATEPITSTTWHRKSWTRNLIQYRAYIEGGGYRDHLRLTAPLLVLNVASDPVRVDRLLQATASELDMCRYHLFQSWESFGPIWRPPSPNTELLDAVWQRAGCPPFRIDQA